MTLARGTDRLELARLVLRRIAPDDLEFFARIHALPQVTQYLYPGGRPRSPEESALWLQSTLEGYEQLALGCLAVLRKDDGALIGRCGLTDLVVELVMPEHGVRQGWFGRARAPAGDALTFECELSYTFDPAVWGQGFATEAVGCVRDYARDVTAAVLRDLGHSPAKRPFAARRRTLRLGRRRPNGWCLIATCGRWRPAVRQPQPADGAARERSGVGRLEAPTTYPDARAGRADPRLL